jgi:AcrR family transcriptional regulator
VTSAATSKPDAQTKRLIIDTAVRLFREQGYEKTTMRAIASAAGLSVGNAYYYFPSKDHLVQEFYTLIQREHRAAVASTLEKETEFAPRLRGVLLALVEVMAPYHAFAGKFIKVAADPDSPLSPFSDESDPARHESLAIFRELVDGTATKIDEELRAELPDLLWLAQMAVTLFWVHDRSVGQAKTRLLIERAVPLADRLVALSRLRVLRGVTHEGLALYRMLRA